MTLKLRQSYDPKSKPVAEVHHGDKLEIVGQRRRLYKLRTAKGVIGWTDERNLMSVDQMNALSELEARAGRMPSEGVASTYEQLNVHTEPQRFSPSFVQINPGEKFDVLARQSASRAEPKKRRVLVKPQPRPESERKPDKKRIPPPPKPAPPGLPRNWVDLSQQRAPAANAKAKKSDDDDEETPEPAPLDDWTLIRSSNGVAGWVLTSRIYLAIPDEVAQYAEGHRITTYFSLGKIRDPERNEDKDIWLWTTVHAGEHPYDYDSFRVFTWNPRRHRYETAYIARKVEGYLPVLVNKTQAGTWFSVCLEQEDGTRLRRRFDLVDRRIQGGGAQPCRPEDMFQAPVQNETPPNATKTPGAEPLSRKLKKEAGQLKRKILGH